MERLRAEQRTWRLAEMRRRLGITRAEAATRMGVPQGRVSAIEHAQPGATELRPLAAYVEALGGRLDIIADRGDERLAFTELGTEAARPPHQNRRPDQSVLWPDGLPAPGTRLPAARKHGGLPPYLKWLAIPNTCSLRNELPVTLPQRHRTGLTRHPFPFLSRRILLDPCPGTMGHLKHEPQARSAPHPGPAAAQALCPRRKHVLAWHRPAHRKHPHRHRTHPAHLPASKYGKSSRFSIIQE